MLKYIQGFGGNMDLILALYLSTVEASLITNFYCSKKYQRKAYKNSIRNLKYRKNLSIESKKILRDIKWSNLYDQFDNIKMSIIPFYNAFDSIQLMNSFDDMVDICEDYYNETIEYTNISEDVVRLFNGMFLRSLKEKISKIPKKIECDLNDETLKVSDKEVKKILKLNKLNYNYEMQNFSKE